MISIPLVTCFICLVIVALGFIPAIRNAKPSVVLASNAVQFVALAVLTVALHQL